MHDYLHDARIHTQLVIVPINYTNNKFRYLHCLNNCLELNKMNNIKK